MSGRRVSAGPSARTLRVCHVSPTYFDPESAIGGGERFAEELASAMARVAEVRLVTFGRRSFRERRLGRERVVLRSWSPSRLAPFSPRLLAELRGADVIHCHQYYTLPTFLACLIGRAWRSRVFVSDLGGGGWTPGYHLDQSRLMTAHLPISEYAAAALPGRNRRYRVIYGGTDTGRWPMRPRPSHDGSVVFLGRVLPHKGVHVLLEGLPSATTLHVVGPTPDPDYLERLRRAAAGKDVRFRGALSDEAIVALLQRAMALVHPTPLDASGSAGANELFGLALVEAMACGCPVVASRVASLPEIVVHGETGLLVPPGSPESIGAALRELGRGIDAWADLSARGRRRVEERFTWDAVVGRCMEAYEEFA